MRMLITVTFVAQLLIANIQTGSAQELLGSNQRVEEGLFDESAFERGFDVDEKEIVIPMDHVSPTGAEDLPTRLYLHVKVRGQCAYFYAKHEHETYVTRDSPSGARFPVAQLSLGSKFSGSSTSKTCTNASSCGRSEQEFNLGCRRSCAAGKASDPRYGTWATREACIW
jgi:hypothetical protein